MNMNEILFNRSLLWLIFARLCAMDEGHELVALLFIVPCVYDLWKYMTCGGM